MQSIIPIVTLCGIGVDLFSLPLLMCFIFLASGLKTPPSDLSWLASWWLVGIAFVVLLAEIVMDTMMDRRKRIFKRMWPTLQFSLSAIVSVIIILALGADLSAVEKVATIGAAWVSIGIIKGGVVENFKRVANYFLP